MDAGGLHKGAAVRAALAAYGFVGEPTGSSLREIDLREAAVQPLGDGLINETFLVEVGSWRGVLQRVNPLFGVLVHEDIEAVTRHLAAKGHPTPILYRTADGGLFVELGDAGVWRLMTFVPGRCVSVMTADRAEPAGELVGRFHAALLDLDHSFRFSRKGAHDLQRHLSVLREARARAEAAGLDAEILNAFRNLADEILRRAEELPAEVPGPLRLCHGDLKLNNLRFDETGRGVCLLDLDTLARLPLGLELGDALRSWCNPRGEDDPRGTFDLDLFERALAGYAVHARGFLTGEERGFLVRGIERIALQLAARFGADVVNQSYFRWNPQKFPSRAEHNLVRARSQLGVAASLAEQRAHAESIAARTLSPQSDGT
jgi:Ser/Thr protein kinase RdoA (MazF antagonist)